MALLLTALVAGLAATLVVISVARALGPTGFVERRRRFKKRMRELSEGFAAAIPNFLKTANYSELPALKSLLSKYHVADRINFLLRLAGFNISVSVFFFASVLLGLVGLVLFLPRMHFLFALFLAVVSGFAPYLYLKYRHRRYLAKFAENLPDALSMIASSIRVGHGLEASFDVVSRNAPTPVSAEFQTVRAEMKLGINMSEALKNLYRRIRSDEIKIFVTGVAIHQEIGGNLTGLLDNLEKTIRDRFAIARELNTLSAQGKLSSWVLLIGPFGMAIMWFMSDPGMFVDYLHSHLGRTLIMIGAVCQAIGFIWIRLLVQLKD